MGRLIIACYEALNFPFDRARHHERRGRSSTRDSGCFSLWFRLQQLLLARARARGKQFVTNAIFPDERLNKPRFGANVRVHLVAKPILRAESRDQASRLMRINLDYGEKCSYPPSSR